MVKYTRLGDLLKDAGEITQEQLNEALELQKKSHKRLGEELVDSDIITERQLIGALQAQLGIDYVDLSEVDIDPAMTKLIPKSVARRNLIVPVRLRGDELYLAMADPLNFYATEEARVSSKKRIVPMIARRAGVEHAISVLYGTEGANRAIREMQQEHEGSGQTRAWAIGAHTSNIETDQESQTPSIRLVDNIIERGISEHASDIHVEPQEENVRVRMRIDGMLHEEFRIPKELQQSLTSRIKIMCDMDVTERRVPQDGRAIVRLKASEVDLRVSTLPTVNGEKIVIRILDRSNKLNTPEELGFSGHNLALYNELIKETGGVILLVGPTGSGKSSTMFTMLNRLNTEQVNIVTLEDPVEFNVAGITQVQVDEKNGTTFASGLRAVLRQDPDIIAVGEIRDAETAAISMRAAVTGHLVISTVHANSARETLDRLDDIGVEPYVQAAALRGVISQRLVRCVCPSCKEEYVATAEELELLGIDPNTHADAHLCRGRGCPDCFGTGYSGRSVTAEVLPVTEELKSAIRTGDHTAIDQAIQREDFVSIQEDARRLVLSGKTTCEEYLRVIGTGV
ncbi:MAG: GspE/PulE family protein [Atopobiaceae bacterium]|jgi:type IV pilus assembly protein PilB